MTDFRLCSACKPHSQAPLCHCTSSPISIRAKGTIARLRYSLANNLPSQTTHQTVSFLKFALRLSEFTYIKRAVFHRRS